MENKRNIMTNRKGLTLLVSLLLLVVMSLMGVVAVNLSVQETKIAQNYESTVVATAWAEAGIEMARQQIVNSTDPTMDGFDCVDNAGRYYPNSTATPNVHYCIELIKSERSTDNSQGRQSGQESAAGFTTYYYKIDAMVERTYSGQLVTVRHIQTLEQQSRYSL